MEEEDANGVNMEFNDSGTPPTLSNYVSNETSGKSSPFDESCLPPNEDSNDRLNSTKKRRNVLSDSEDDEPAVELSKTNITNGLFEKAQSSSEDDNDSIFKSNPSKSRIKAMSSSEDDDVEVKLTADSDSNSSSKILSNGVSNADSEHRVRSKLSNSDNNSSNSGSSSEDEAPKQWSKSMSIDTEQRIRMKNKRNKLSQKFKSITKSHNAINNDESESAAAISKICKTNETSEKRVQSSSENEDNSIFKSKPSKSRIKAVSSSEDDDKEVKLTADPDSNSSSKIISAENNGISAIDSTPNKLHNKLDNSDKNSSSNSEDEVLKQGSNSNSSSEETEQQMRIKNKRNKLSQKFKSLINSRNGMNQDQNDNSAKSDSSEDSDEATSIEKIKQKIKERSNHLKSTIYDPDTSDDEKAHHIEINKRKVKTKSKKAEVPKPVRMSAKQAMENMQKIKSESNRMLREKEVSLPYHRPKALSLKDIMSRRKPALAADGKALPLKMNEDQLRQYALQLEERQKEMIELCKSESEEEDEETKDVNETNDNLLNTEEQTNKDSEENKDEQEVNGDNEIKNEQNLDITAPEDSKDISQVNDDLFDTQVSKDSPNETAEETLKDNGCVLEGREASKPSMEDDSQLMKLRFDSELVTDTEKSLTETIHEIQETDPYGKDRVGNDPNTVRIDENLVNETSIDNTKDHEQNNMEKVDDDNPKLIEIDDEIKDTIEDYERPKDKSVDEEKAMDVAEIVEKEKTLVNSKENVDEEIDGFSDDDIDMADIDKMIEDADLIVENATQNASAFDSPMLIRDFKPTITKPKLTGAPGMVIDLDGTDATGPKKQSGIELLKERFTFFAMLKTPEEIERQKQNRVKPGIQHLKLKQQLEEQIAEQRSLEWAKRLDEEKQQQAEMNAIRGDDDDDDIEKIEAKIDDNDQIDDNDESEESEPEENDVILEDKPAKKNPLVDDEAEESDIDEETDAIANEADDEQNDEENGDESEGDESSESSDDELEAEKPKKGRILKAFEDSDDEDGKIEVRNEAKNLNLEDDKNKCDELGNTSEVNETESQDIELESAQLHKSISEDIFTSQESEITKPIEKHTVEDIQKMPVICETQPYDELKFDEIAGMCSGSFSQNATTLPVDTQQQSQDIGDNVLALCTGKFYDNQFVSQTDETNYKTADNSVDKGDNSTDLIEKDELSTNVNEVENVELKLVEDKTKVEDKKLLQSILLELDDPEFDNPKPNKFFTGGASEKVEKKRFFIDSDDEEKPEEVTKKKRRRKLEDRALQISDDEEEELGEEEEELISDLEEDDGGERLVEYDSEENEVELKQNPITKKKKRKTTEFFEQEAELTSEDEWVGSGDEDEAGLDRMEREEGDSDTFHQGRLQRELGQIHMRDVMDQDKREVRLLQELLLEDGDLGGGSRQRKFRWKNADGEEATGTNVDEFGDSQEEEFETEEQWRKQRHERDVFLKSMMQKEGDPEDTSSPVTFNRSAIIKASLNKSNNTSVQTEVKPVNENHTAEKTAKDVPSPVKKPFGLLQANFRGSILSRGSGTLARLGALAAPLADADRPASLPATTKRNFVFAALSPADDKPKISKRKAEDVGTPNLMKKLKTDEKRKTSAKTSLLDHFKT